MGRRIHIPQESTEPGQTLWEGTGEAMLCLALLQSISQACSLPSKMLHPRREEALYTQVPYSSLRLALSKCLLIRKALKITWENILWFYLPTIWQLECSGTAFTVSFTSLSWEKNQLSYTMVVCWGINTGTETRDTLRRLLAMCHDSLAQTS